MTAVAERTTSNAFDGELMPHQIEAVEWLRERPKAVLADDVGLGKTASVLAHIADLEANGMLPLIAAGSQHGSSRVLWLTPSSLVEQTRQEIARFLPSFSLATSNDPTWRTNSRGRAEWGDLFGRGPDILIVSHDQAVASSRRGWLGYVKPGLLVVDEASAVGQGSGRDALEGLSRRLPRVVGMTATPLQNNPLELFNLLALVDVDRLWVRSKFEQFVHFREFTPPGRVYPISQPDGWVDEKLAEGFVAPFLHGSSRLPGVLLRRTAEGLGIAIPEVLRTTQWVTLTEVQRDAYQGADRMQNPLMAHQRRESSQVFAGTDSALVDALISELLERGRPSAIVGTERLNMLDLVETALEGVGVTHARIDGSTSATERSDRVAAHRSGEVSVLLGSQVLEHGLNLQHCPLLISLDSSWNPARESQREGRIRRIGSPFSQVEHVRLLPDTNHSRSREYRLGRKLATADCVGL